MILRAVFGAIAFGIGSCLSLAADYVLYLPSSSSLKDAGALRVYTQSSPPSTGDRIVRVVFGRPSVGSTSVRVMETSSTSGSLLAARGSASGYSGEIRLSNADAPRRATAGQLTPAPAQAAPAKPKAKVQESGFAALLKGFPWGIVLAVAGGIAVLFVLFRTYGAKSEGMPVGPNTKKLEREIHGVGERIEKLERGQSELLEGAKAAQSVSEKLETLERRLTEGGATISVGDGSAISPELGPVRDALATLSERAERMEAAFATIKESLASAPVAVSESGGAAAFDISPLLSAMKEQESRLEARFAELQSQWKSLQERVTVEGGQSAGADVAAQKEVLESLETLRASVESLGQSTGEDAAAGKRFEELAAAIGALESGQAELRRALEAATVSGGGDGNASAEILGKVLLAVEGLKTVPEQVSSVPASLQSFTARLESISELTAQTQALSATVASLERGQSELRHALDAAATARAAEAAATGGDPEALAKMTAALEPLAGVPESVQVLAAKLEAINEHSAQIKALSATLESLERGQSELRHALDAAATARAAEAAATGGDAEALAKMTAALEPLGTVSESIRALSAKTEAMSEAIAALQIAQAELQASVKAEAGSTGPDPALAALTEAQSKLSNLPEAVQAVAERLAAQTERAQRFEAEIDHVRQALSALLAAKADEPLVDERRMEHVLEVSQKVEALAESIQAMNDRQTERSAQFESQIREIQAALAVTAPGANENAGEAISREIASLQTGMSALAASLAELADPVRDLCEWADRGRQDMDALKQGMVDLSTRERSNASGVSEDRIEAIADSIAGCEMQLSDLQARMEKMASVGVSGHGIGADTGDVLRGIEEQLGAVFAKLERIGSGVPSSTPSAKHKEAAAQSDAGLLPGKSFDREGPEEHDVPHYTLDDTPKAGSESAVRAESAPTPAAVEAFDDEPWATNEDSKAGAWQWLCEGGGPERHGSVFSSQELELPDSGAPMTALTPAETPEPSAPIGQVRYAMGMVVYGHGDALRGFWPGKEARAVQLSGTLPTDERCLVANGAKVYCALPEKVEVVQIGTWARSGSFEGAYFDQLCTASHWIGLKADGAQVSADFRGEDGALIGEPASIPVSQKAVRMTAALGESLLVGTESGEVLQVNEKGVSAVCEGGRGELKYLGVWEKSVVLLRVESGGLTAVRAKPDGTQIGRVPLEIKSLSTQPVIMGRTLYVFDEPTGEIATFDLKGMKKGPRVKFAGMSSLVSLCGLQHDQRRLLLGLGVDKETRSGLAIVFEPSTGYVLQVAKAPVHGRVAFLPADRRLILAEGSEYQNVVRVFDPFKASESEAKSAA